MKTSEGQATLADIKKRRRDELEEAQEEGVSRSLRRWGAPLDSMRKVNGPENAPLDSRRKVSGPEAPSGDQEVAEVPTICMTHDC